LAAVSLLRVQACVEHAPVNFQFSRCDRLQRDKQHQQWTELDHWLDSLTHSLEGDGRERKGLLQAAAAVVNTALGRRTFVFSLHD